MRCIVCSLLVMEDKYDSRPSREDDLEMIESLRSDSEFKRKQIMTLTNELNFLRLEISNREENYNKIFNNRPNVGLMQTIGLTNNYNDKTVS